MDRSRLLLPEGKLLNCLIRSLLPQHAIIVLLLLQSQLMVVLARIRIVEIGKFLDIGNMGMRLLEDRNADSHVIRCAQVLAIIVLQVFLLYIKEELSVKGTQVASHEGVLTVSVATYDFFREGSRVAHISTNTQEITVDKPCIFLLEDRTVKFEHLSTNQLIIAIHNQEYLLRTAEVLGSHAQIGHGSHLMRIYDQFESLSRHFRLILHEKANLFPRAISGCIIDEDYMVIGVILHEYAAHVLEMPLLGHIVVTGHHHTERKLLVVANIVFLLVVIALLIGYGRILPIYLLLVHREMPSLHSLDLSPGNTRNGT